MNVSVPGSLYRLEVEIVSLLDRLLTMLRSGRLGSYEASLIDRVIKWLRNEQSVLDKELSEDIQLVVRKAVLTSRERDTLKDAIKLIESVIE